MSGLKWYQDGEGDTSTMRVLAMLAGGVGALTVVVGLGIAVVGAILTWRARSEGVALVAQGVALAAVGAGTAGLGELSKAWQAQKGA